MNIFVIFTIVVITILGLALPQTSFSEMSPFSVITFVEKHELEESNVAVVQFTLINNSEKSIELTDKAYLTDSKNNHIPYSISKLENTSCMTDIPTINSNMKKNIKLCFEIPVSSEKYNLVLEHSGITESIPLYLDEHQITTKPSYIDLKKLFVTIHSANIIDSSIGDIVVVELSIYNGDLSDASHFQLTKANTFFITDVNDKRGSNVVGTYMNGDVNSHVREKCLDLKNAYSGEITTVTMCFERPIMNNNKYDDTGFFLTVNDHTAYEGCQNCQQKILGIVPYLFVNNVSDSTLNLETNSQKIPSWVKDTMQWYLDGVISEDEMINAIQFLVKNNIIDIS